MRFNKALWLDIFEYTDEELELAKIVDVPEAGLNTFNKRAFWCIDSAYRYEGSEDKTAFFSGGESFVTVYEFNAFVRMIDKHNK